MNYDLHSALSRGGINFPVLNFTQHENYHSKYLPSLLTTERMLIERRLLAPSIQETKGRALNRTYGPAML